MRRGLLDTVSARCRILVALEPRVLAEAVAEVLDRIGLDDVVLAGRDLPGGSFDVALVSGPRAGLRAEVLVEIPIQGPSRVSGPDTDVPITVLTPVEIIEILDRYCVAAAPRAEQLAALIPRTNG